MIYLCNAISMSMLAPWRLMDSDPTRLTVQPVTLDDARSIVAGDEWVSAVGHADTAALMGALLGVTVPANRVSVELTDMDSLLVGQYSGPRLPEGATTLPEGATLRWLLVTIED